MSDPVGAKITPQDIYTNLRRNERLNKFEELQPKETNTLKKVLLFLSGKSLAEPSQEELKSLNDSISDLRRVKKLHTPNPEDSDMKKLYTRVHTSELKKLDKASVQHQSHLANLEYLNKCISAVKIDDEAELKRICNLATQVKYGYAFYLLAAKDPSHKFEYWAQGAKLGHTWCQNELAVTRKLLETQAKVGGPPRLLELSRFLLKTGDYAQAEKALIKGLKWQSSQTESQEGLRELGKIYEERGQVNSAKKMYKVAGEFGVKDLNRLLGG